MTKGNKNKDIISEDDFNMQMNATSRNPADPAYDSPDDSESDAGKEFNMGLNYRPVEVYADQEEEEAEELEMAEDENEDDIIEKKINTPKPRSPKSEKLIEDAKVVSSNQPAPWLDLEAPTDTH